MLQTLKESTEYLQKRIDGFTPETGIVLGAGLSGLVKDMEIMHSVLYANIPNFPISTLEFHSGKFIFGKLKGKNAVAMQGRLHYYRGYPMQQITFPVRVMNALGIKQLFMSNASGCLNPAFKKGELMILEDHINLLPESPLRGVNDDELETRFAGIGEPYNQKLIKKTLEIANLHNPACYESVYAVARGPNLETKTEYKYLRIIGGDAAGISTVSEVIVTNHTNIPVFALPVLTDEGFQENPKSVNIEKIIAVAKTAEPYLTTILSELIASV